ncbi:MAG: hypothetical protein V1794_12430, partial [Candidatus Glassbacteria bacterium]
AAAGSYFRADDSGFHFGNDYLERVFSREGDTFRSTWLVNQVTGHTWRVGGGEFEIRLTFERLGYWPGLENPLVIGADECVFRSYRVEAPVEGRRRLVLQYHWEQGLSGEEESADRDSPGLEIEVAYTVSDSLSWMHKEIRLSCEGGEYYFLEKLSVEDLEIAGAECLNQGFGQPVYTGEMFFGLEYPAGNNQFDGTRLRLFYYPGEKIGPRGFASYRSVWGVAREGRTRASFLAYLDRIRYAPARPFLLYNTWYDLRTPERAEGGRGGILDLQSCLDRVASFKRNLTDQGIPLHSFVLDEGWDTYTPFWEIDRKNFPGGFDRLNRALKEIGSGLGLWLGPIGGYGEGLQLRGEKGRQAGLEVSKKGYLDLAGPRYGKLLTGRLLDFVEKYDVNYYKFDGVVYGYADTDHGLLPGIYSRERQTAALAALCDSLHAARPGLFINLTTSQWLSPWWLLHADCVFMGGGDFGWLNQLPSPTKRDLSTSYRDKICYDQFVRYNQQFPLNSIMTVGVIKGEYELLGELDETLDKWTNDLVIHFSRGVGMWELYLSPQILKENEWEALRSVLRWSQAEQGTLLANTTVLGGDPAERRPYGYFHQGAGKLILTVRNPYVDPAVFTMKLDYPHGLLEKSAGRAWLPVTVYPYRAFEADWVSEGEEYAVSLDGYETRVVEFWPADSVDFPLPFGVRFATGDKGTVVFPADNSGKILVENCSSQAVSVSGVTLPPGIRGEVPFAGPSTAETIEVLDRRTEEIQGRRSTLSGELEIRLPANTVDAEIAFLVESAGPLPGLAAQILDCGRKTAQRTTAGSGDRWYWFTSRLAADSLHRLSYSFTADSAAAGPAVFSAWIVLHRELDGRPLDLPGFSRAVAGRFRLPAESSLKREATCLFKRPVEF